MMVNQLCLIASVSRYLHRLLLPSYLFAARSSTFNNGFDVVQALEQFSKKKGYLKSTSQFFIYEVNDFDMTFEHEEMLNGLDEFLSYYVFNSATTATKMNVSQETTRQLVQLVLQRQFFVYDKKLYQQTRGGDRNSSLIQLLMDIYLLCWQHKLTGFLRKTKQFYGR